MIPDGVLSSEVISGPYLYPMRRRKDLLIDYSMGGIGITDPSQGLVAQLWTAHYEENGDIILEGANGASLVPFNREGITEFSFTFDQTMRPVITFVVNNVTTLWWFDPQSSGMIFTVMPTGVLSPRLTMDEPRASELLVSDVILSYVREGKLCYRQQRERYAIEHVLIESGIEKLYQVGLNTKGRLQWRCLTS